MSKGHALSQPIHLHLQELRKRLILYILILGIFSLLGYFYNDILLQWLIKPLHQKIYYTSPAGGFNFTVQFSLFVGFILSLPFLIYQVVEFIRPAYPQVSINLLKFILISFTLTMTGILFAYFLILPSALYFLQNFANKEYLQSLITTNEYFSFILAYLGGFALFFQLPLVFYIINTAIKLKWQTFLLFQKYIIIISFLIAAITTPTGDIVNLLLMTVPILLLFYISIIEIAYLNRKSKSP